MSIKIKKILNAAVNKVQRLATVCDAYMLIFPWNPAADRLLLSAWWRMSWVYANEHTLLL